jgi:hypothetical protein
VDETVSRDIIEQVHAKWKRKKKMKKYLKEKERKRLTKRLARPSFLTLGDVGSAAVDVGWSQPQARKCPTRPLNRAGCWATEATKDTKRPNNSTVHQ